MMGDFFLTPRIVGNCQGVSVEESHVKTKILRCEFSLEYLC